MYQMACLMNTNNYDFDLKGDMKEKLKGLLAKKEGVESGDKKEGKVMNNARTKNELLRGEQGLKEDELEILLV